MARSYKTSSFFPVKNGPRPTARPAGKGESAGPTQETAAQWGPAGAPGPAAFNRKTQWPVVKTHARSHGVPA